MAAQVEAVVQAAAQVTAKKSASLQDQEKIQQQVWQIQANEASLLWMRKNSDQSLQKEAEAKAKKITRATSRTTVGKRRKPDERVVKRATVAAKTRLQAFTRKTPDTGAFFYVLEKHRQSPEYPQFERQNGFLVKIFAFTGAQIRYLSFFIAQQSAF